MPLNFEEIPQQHSSADSMSEKTRDVLNVLQRFRAPHAPHPVFQSSRSRHNDSEVILDWSEK